MANKADALDQRAAAQLNVEILPGTEVMTDVGDVHFAHAGGSERGSVLIPHPSNDPADPLNWSRMWKYGTAISQLLYVWVLVCCALSIAPMFPIIGAEFRLTEQQLSLLTGVNVLTLGFANILIVPLSNIFGRRPISIFFGVMVVLTNIWTALATSHKSLLGARACNGIAAATSETIMVQVIADMFFLHERGFWVGAYFTFYFFGAFLGPIMSGNIAARHGWRSFFWLSVALAVFVTLLLVFLFPETKYVRDGVNRAGGKAEKYEGEIKSEANSDGEVGGAMVGKGKPSKMQYSPIQRPDSNWWKYIVRDITTPIIVFFNPIIFWAALMLMGPADLLLLFNLTESGLFANPETYAFSPGQVGYTNFAFFVGGVIGVTTAGPLSDWWARRATIKNNGIREAEMRLPALLPYVCIYIISHVVGAVGYQRLWPWQAIIVCGFGFSGLAVTSIPGISIAYAVDCYKPISGEIMVVATVMKNILGFCLSYWIFKVAATSNGWVKVYMTQFAYDMLPIVLTIPLYFWGKRLRRMTMNSDLHKRAL